jgi:hypothetical protein
MTMTHSLTARAAPFLSADRPRHRAADRTSFPTYRLSCADAPASRVHRPKTPRARVLSASAAVSVREIPISRAPRRGGQQPDGRRVSLTRLRISSPVTNRHKRAEKTNSPRRRPMPGHRCRGGLAVTAAGHAGPVHPKKLNYHPGYAAGLIGITVTHPDSRAPIPLIAPPQIANQQADSDVRTALTGPFQAAQRGQSPVQRRCRWFFRCPARRTAGRMPRIRSK